MGCTSTCFSMFVFTPSFPNTLQEYARKLYVSFDMWFSLFSSMDFTFSLYICTWSSRLVVASAVGSHFISGVELSTCFSFLFEGGHHHLHHPHHAHCSEQTECKSLPGRGRSHTISYAKQQPLGVMLSNVIQCNVR